MLWEDFPGGPVVKISPCNARDSGSIPGQETKLPHALEHAPQPRSPPPLEHVRHKERSAQCNKNFVCCH